MSRGSLAAALSLGAAITAYILTPFLIALFRRSGQLRQNYRGRQIPQGIGFLFVFCSLPWSAPYLAISEPQPAGGGGQAATVLLLLMALALISLLGLVDDLLGSRRHLGLTGHLGALLAGELTTGALKAAGGLLTAAFCSNFLLGGGPGMIVGTLVLALSANLLNLTDLRPGRAIKFYLLLMIALGIRSRAAGSADFLLWLPLTGAVVGYLPYDLKGLAMMGDAGSNALGFAAGLLAVRSLGGGARLLLAAALIAVHLFTERYSLSEIIAGNRLLRLLDDLGRRD